MKLFENRPLAIFCVSFLGGVFSVAYISDWVGLLPTLFAFLLLLAMPLLLRGSIRTIRLAGRRALLLSLCASAVLFGQVSGLLCFRLYYAAAPESEGEEAVVVLRVTEIRYESDYSTCLYAELESLDGKTATGRVVWESEENHLLSVGDRVSLTATVTAFHDTRVADEELYLQADGVRARITDAHAVTFLSHAPTLSDRITRTLAEWRDLLSRRLHGGMPGDAGALMQAMLLGERDSLPADIRRDFRRLGLSHILALSGLHLGLLAGGLAALLRRMHVPRRYAIPLEAVLVVFYIFLTGASLSILRAGTMLLFSLAAFFLAREPDSVTSLSLAAALIVLVSPYSVFDIGFLLSVTATLGILTVTELTPQSKQPEGRAARLWHAIRASAAVSLGAILATLPLTVLFFGEIPLLALPANLLLAPLLSFYLMLAPFALLFSGIPLFAAACNLAGEALLSTIAALSHLPGITLSADHPLPRLFLFATAAAMLFLLCFLPRRRLVAMLVCIGVLATSLSLFGVRALAYPGRTAYLSDVGKDEAILLVSENRGMLWDFTDGTYGDALTSFSLLDEAHLTELEGYALSHYHARQPGTLRKMAARYIIRRLYLPTPASPTEERIYRELLASAEALGIPCYRYTDYEELDFHALTVIPHARGTHRSSSHPTLGLTVCSDTDRLTYLSGGSHGSSTKNAAASAVSLGSILIFGTHGPAESKDLPYHTFSRGLTDFYCEDKEGLPSSLRAVLDERGVLTERRVFPLR